LHLGLATQSFGVTLPLMLLLDQEYIQPVVIVPTKEKIIQFFNFPMLYSVTQARKKN
jgi:hypothetical protein